MITIVFWLIFIQVAIFCIVSLYLGVSFLLERRFWKLQPARALAKVQRPNEIIYVRRSRLERI